MNQEEKWKAVIECDKGCDGLFYYAVKTTGIVCRPSCKARAPLRENTLFFEHIDLAITQGFRPCKICRPDLLVLEYQPNKEVVEKAKELLRDVSTQNFDVSYIAKELGFSSSHFSRLFKQYQGMSPNEYHMQIRMELAKRLLTTTTEDIIDIAYQTGFKSLSNFYKCFGEQTGMTPKQYRKQNKKI